MVSLLAYAAEGPRIFLASWKNRLFPKRYEGDAKKICQQIIQDCWNGRFFQTSAGHFCQFWTRDLGWCTQSLMKLGYQTEVQQSLRYALHRFQKAKRITTTITPWGKAFDFPTPAVDSLPWLIHAIAISKFSYSSFKPFLNVQIARYAERFIDKQTGLVKPNLHVSSIKDFAKRHSSCYDNCMLGMLAHDLRKLKLDNPLAEYDYPSLIRRHFWSGEYFFDDLSRQSYVAGDANLFPFLTGMCRDKDMLQSVIMAVHKAQLDQPLPLKYTNSRHHIRFIFSEPLLYNYEGTSIWTHLGPLWIRVVGSLDPELAKTYLFQYRELIEKHRNYPEVLNAQGKLFRTPFYAADEGMLWAANYLAL